MFPTSGPLRETPPEPVHVTNPPALPLKSAGRVPGRIRLVGAGPGGIEFLTLAGVDALQNADVVVSDRLVPAEVLALARGEIYIAKKTPGRADLAQQELHDEVLKAAKAGKDVIRLKNGDPFVFGRGGEEILEFRAHGFPVEVIPGVSSSYAAPLRAGIPLTMRGVADQFVVTTAHGRAGTTPKMPEYCESRTVVLLMGVGKLPGLHDTLTTLGYPSDVPVAVVESATNKKERVTRGTLDSIAGLAAARQVKAPATIIVGKVVSCLSESASHTQPSISRPREE